jgi:hypothetical protein
VSLNTTLVARRFLPSEIPDEIAAVLAAIDNLQLTVEGAPLMG